MYNQLSVITPSRSNLKYLQWQYEAIRSISKDIELCYADDFSIDNTKEWLEETAKKDPNLKYIINPGPVRAAHTLLYDKLIRDVSTRSLFGIMHADMFPHPQFFDNIFKHLQKGTIVSGTRVEPSLHPAGPEKLQADFGIEVEQFKKREFIAFADNQIELNKDKFTNGIFAPFFAYKEDHLYHDPLYYPQSKEDSDLFNRYLLAGYQLVQSRDAFVYHLTCRGSRYNPTLTTIGTNSDEWNQQNQISHRNFIRKWGTVVLHDHLLLPIVLPKYNIGLIIKNTELQKVLAGRILQIIEPYMDTVYIDEEFIKEYTELEQKNTDYDFNYRLKTNNNVPDNDIIITLDLNNFTQNDIITLQHLPQIFSQEMLAVGEFMLGKLKVIINKVSTYEKGLIKVDTKTKRLPYSRAEIVNNNMNIWK